MGMTALPKVLCAGLLLSGCEAADVPGSPMSIPPMRLHPQADVNSKKETIDLIINGIRLRIPRQFVSYYDSSEPRPGINLEFILPDYSALSVEDAATTSYLSRDIRVALRQVNTSSETALAGWRAAYYNYEAQQAIGSVTILGGLKCKKSSSRFDVEHKLIICSDSKTNTFAVCDDQGTRRIPLCHAIFIDGNLIVETYYPTAFVGNSSTILNNLKSLVNQWRA